MSRTSALGIVFVVVFTIFYTLPKIFFIAKPVKNAPLKVQEVNIPKSDGFEENKKLELLLEKYNFSKKELNFYRDYTSGITVNRFDIRAMGEKEDIFKLAGDVSKLENITIKGINIQKIGEFYLIRMEIIFVGV